ncbi:uncharacterized protein EAE97_001022 [Botrytis byssoidea]|uniref:Uncharacterized protein n=1 Tax=Botrytis byssoidea TaxID=139641 RepID=A0A9P5IXH6_9HELO|nr:uncharacterized protein EAE97_001022 [Botrytis byssoidea]KAF7953623.1 hypothetical protein EAE97_001022 [Botrytis byssoidea]
MHTLTNFIHYLPLLALLHPRVSVLAHSPSQAPLTSPEKCISYSATFLTPYTSGALEPHASAKLPGFCEGIDEPVALHPNIVDDWGYVYDFSSGCGCDGVGGDGSERFWVYFPVEINSIEKDKQKHIFASPGHANEELKKKNRKKKCHGKNEKTEEEMEIEIMEPWILHAEGCEDNRGDAEINGGLGTCEEGILRTWQMGVSREDWREMRSDGGMVWIVEGWDKCEELEGRLGHVEEEEEDIEEEVIEFEVEFEIEEEIEYEVEFEIEFVEEGVDDDNDDGIEYELEFEIEIVDVEDDVEEEEEQEKVEILDFEL